MLTWNDYREAGNDDSRTDGLNELVDPVEGMKMGIMICETQPGHCLVSVPEDDPSYVPAQVEAACRAYMLPMVNELIR